MAGPSSHVWSEISVRRKEHFRKEKGPKDIGTSALAKFSNLLFVFWMLFWAVKAPCDCSGHLFFEQEAIKWRRRKEKGALGNLESKK